MTQRKLQTLIERDIMQLKLLLKLRMASYETIKQKEQKHIDHFHNTLKSVKTIERHLQRELRTIDALRKKAEKEHKVKRWNAIHGTLKEEIKDFHNRLRDGSDFVAEAKSLHNRLTDFQQILKSARRKPQEHELKVIRTFAKTK